jgi:hypothetical protein
MIELTGMIVIRKGWPACQLFITLTGSYVELKTETGEMREVKTHLINLKLFGTRLG